MENFNINDMKNLFGSTPINGLPGVQGYANHKINWPFIGLSFLIGICFHWLLSEAAAKKNKTYVLPKKYSPPEKPAQEADDEIPDNFDKYDLEIEDAGEFDSIK